MPAYDLYTVTERWIPVTATNKTSIRSYEYMVPYHGETARPSSPTTDNLGNAEKLRDVLIAANEAGVYSDGSGTPRTAGWWGIVVKWKQGVKGTSAGSLTKLVSKDTATTAVKTGEEKNASDFVEEAGGTYMIEEAS